MAKQKKAAAAAAEPAPTAAAANPTEDISTHALVAQQNQIEQSLDEKIKRKLESEEQAAAQAPQKPQMLAEATTDAAAQVEELLKDGTSVSDLQR